MLGALIILRSMRPSRAKDLSAGNGTVFSFGVIADVQWADAEDGSNFDGSVRRCFRGAFEQLERACEWWRGQPLDFVAQLGDLIDGKNVALGQSGERG